MTGGCCHERQRAAAAAVYPRDRDANHQPYGICVLTVTSEGIRRITSFGDPGLITVFGFPSLRSRRVFPGVEEPSRLTQARRRSRT